MNTNKALLLGLIAIVILAMAGTYLLKEPPDTSAAVAVAPDKKPAAAGPAAVAPVAMTAAPNAETGGKDYILGSAAAPVTIIEYASMTCSHCAHFTTDILPQIKKSLIETGKARLIFRDFPLDGVALKAAMLARCMPDDKYFGFVEAVFADQPRWIGHSNPVEGLKQLAALAGMDDAKSQACLDDKTLEKTIVDGVQKAQAQYKISSTPSFVFNGGAEVISGAQDAKAFEDAVTKLTGGK